MTTGLLLRADDGFSVYAGTVWPTDGYDTAWTRDMEHHHVLGVWPSWPFITSFKTAKDIFIAYKSSQTLS